VSIFKNKERHTVMRNIIVGSLVAITLAALAVVAAGVSTARAEDFEVEFMEFSIDKKFPINPSTREFQVKGKGNRSGSYERGLSWHTA
jgi:hypothetical protein